MRRDPSLPRVWLSLAAERERQHDLVAAWRLLIEGLSHNRSSETLEDSARKLWRWLPSPDREEALKWLKNQFADEADTWEKRLQVAATPLGEIKSQSPSIDSPLGPPEVGELLPREEDSPRTGRRVRPRKTLPIDPDQTDSASEGRTL